MDSKNATARWPDLITLNGEQIRTLEQLYKSAIAAENSINEQCKVLLGESGITDIPSGHGEAIKQFFHHFYQSSQKYDSESVFKTYINKYADELNKTINLNKNELIEFGIGALLEELKQNTSKKQYTYARGNYAELHLFEGLYNGLKKEFGDNIVLVDTSPKNYENSIRYDINVLLSLPDKDDLDINIESKKGVTESYIDSKFDLGTFSDTGFSLKSNEKIYASLIDSLQKDFYKFINTATKTSTETDKWVREQLVDWSIQYIKWRLNNNFPIFASDVNGGNINLSSEIIKGFQLNPGGSVEYTLGDMLTFVNLDTTYNYHGQANIARYISTKTDISKRTLEEYVKGSGWIKRKDFKTTFQRGTKITPLFKATVWYGK